MTHSQFENEPLRILNIHGVQSFDSKTFPNDGIQHVVEGAKQFPVTFWGCVVDQRRLSKISFNVIYENIYSIWGDNFHVTMEIKLFFLWLTNENNQGECFFLDR